jgi:hypothetical protein
MSWDDEDWDGNPVAVAPKDAELAITDKWEGEDEDEETLLGDDW